MDETTKILKDLEKEHQKAMEAIKAFNNVSKETINEAKEQLGLK